MTRFFRTFACVLLMFAARPSVVVSQELNDVFNEFQQGYGNELSLSSEQMKEYEEASKQIYEASSKKQSEIMQKRLSDLEPNPSQEEITKIGNEAFVDTQLGSREPRKEKIKEIFLNEQYQKMQQRQFQMHESVMRRLESFNNHEEYRHLLYLSPDVDLFGDLQPDFLDLTPEQRELITRQQRDVAINIQVLLHDTVEKGFEKSKKFQQLAKKLGEIPVEDHGKAEAQEIIKQIQKLEPDIYKDGFPKLKEILLKSREDYMRVLTDAQKAKIKAVMADMPDYMKNLFAEIDRQGGGLSILHSWQPGMGVPDFPNPNREAPRERPQSERAFPE